MKRFKYLQWFFTPVRQFTKVENEQNLMLKGLRSFGISNYSNMHNSLSDQWDYNEFYKKAKKAGAGKIDIFSMKGKQVVPCSNELFEYQNPLNF